MHSAEQLEQAYVDALASALGNVAARFRMEPASFLCERDLQALLFARLFDSLSDVAVTWDQEDVGVSGVTTGQPLRVNPVKTEYPAEERFDVAVLAPALRRGSKAWSQRVVVGVELKLWQADGCGGHFADDRTKLDRYRAAANSEARRFTGVAVAFCHLPGDWRLREWAGSAQRIDGTGTPAISANSVNPFVVAPSLGGSRRAAAP